MLFSHSQQKQIKIKSIAHIASKQQSSSTSVVAQNTKLKPKLKTKIKTKLKTTIKATTPLSTEPMCTTEPVVQSSGFSSRSITGLSSQTLIPSNVVNSDDKTNTKKLKKKEVESSLKRKDTETTKDPSPRPNKKQKTIQTTKYVFIQNNYLLIQSS